MIPFCLRPAASCRCPCFASTSNFGPLPPRSGAAGARSRKNEYQQQRPSTLVAAQLRSQAETLESLSTLPASWDEADLTDERLSRALQARIERCGVQHAAAEDDAPSATDLSQGPSKPSRQAAPASLVRRRQRQLSGRRSRALRARRAGDNGSVEPCAFPSKRTRGRRRASIGGATNVAKAVTRSSRGGSVKGEDAHVTRYLTREEEIELCTATQRARILQQIRDDVAVAEQRQLSDDEWAEKTGLPSAKALQSVLAAGQAAGRRLIDVNKGLFNKLTWQFCHQGVTQEELIVEAEEELLRVASEFFDASKGARLTTIAWYHIMNRLTKVVTMEGGLLPMSVKADAMARRMDATEGELSQELGRMPTMTELAAKVGISRERAQLLRTRKRGTLPWDSKIQGSAGDDDTFGGDDWIADDWEIEHEREEQERSLQSVIELALDMVREERTRRIMKWRYGLADGKPHTLGEVARLLFEHETRNEPLTGYFEGPRRTGMPKKPLSEERIRLLILEGREEMQAFIREHNLLRDLLEGSLPAVLRAPAWHE